MVESNATGLAVSQVGPKESTAPVQRSLASVVTKILFLSSVSWLITVRHSRDTTISFILSKAFWYVSFHGGKFFIHSFVVKRERIEL